MSTVFTIVVALLVLNLLVVIHELGHYCMARIFKVTIHEFSIGMGPKLFTVHGKHNDFSLRVLPLGGFVAMEGEDEESNDPNAFNRKKAWQRLLILVAGAAMNLLFGLVLTTTLVLMEPKLPSTTVDVFMDGAVSVQSGLQEGDRIVKMDRKNIYVYSDVVFALTSVEDGECDITVVRNGEKVLLQGVKFATSQIGSMTVSDRDFYFSVEPKNVGNVLKHSFFRAVSFGRAIYDSLVDLVRGRYSISEVSGPVGTVEVIGEAAKSGIDDLLYLAAFITINLGIFNLLPLPALDGGRILFVLIELLRGKPVPAKYEGMVHFVGFAALILLIVVVTFFDIKGLIVG